MNGRENSKKSVIFRSALCLIAVLAQGYSFGYGNHTTLIPMIRHYQGHNLLHNDLIIDILPAYTTFFYKVLSLIPAGPKGLEIIFIVLYAVSMYFFYHGMMRLFDLLGADAVASCLGGLAVAVGVMPILGLSPWQYKLDHGAPGMALAAWSLYYYFKNREVRAFCLLGVCFNIHALYAAHLFILFSLHLLTRFTKESLNIFLKAASMFTLLAFPVIIWKFHSMGGDDMMTKEWIEIIYNRLGWQVFLSDTPTSYLLYFGVFVSAVFIVYKRHRITYDRDSAENTVDFMFFTIILLVFIQILLTDVIPLRPALEGQFFRATQWLAIIGIFLIIHRIIRFAEAENTTLIQRAAVAGAVSMVFTNTVLGLIIAVAGHVIASGKMRHYGVYAWYLIVYVIILSGLVLSRRFAHVMPDISWKLNFPNGREASFILALLIGAYMFFARLKWRKFTWAGLMLIVLLYAYMNNPVYRSVNSVNDDPWIEVQLWAKDNTPPESLFITPPTMSGFRVLSDRAVFAEVKDGGMVNNSRKYAMEWLTRMKLLGVENVTDFRTMRRHENRYVDIHSGFSRKKTGELREISRRYDADYIVTLRAHTLSLPIVWMNSEYIVYQTIEQG